MTTMASLLNEERMFRAVITQALTDAISKPPRSASMGERLEHVYAREFFEQAGSWFQTVCLCAGLEPSQVQRLALKQIAEADGGGVKRFRKNRSDQTSPSAQDRT